MVAALGVPLFLEGLELPVRGPDDDLLRGECRRILAWFWHDVAHTLSALGRGQLWWAHGQIEALRGYRVDVVRLEQRSAPGDGPYWKIDEEVDAAPLAALEATILPLERAALTGAASELVAFFGAHGRLMLRELGSLPG